MAANPLAPKPTNKLEVLYYKYEFLVYGYSAKLYNYEQLGMEREDITQELKVKLYTSILGYLKTWKLYRTTGKRKPIPMYYYLRSCMGNHLNDLIIKIKRNEEVFEPKTSSNECGGFADIGCHNPNVCEIDLGVSKVAVINGIDLNHGLVGTELAIWVLFLKGRNIREIQDMLRSRFRNCGNSPKIVTDVINKQRAYLQRYREQLTLESDATYYVKEIVED